jgi:hypothetical protein
MACGIANVLSSWLPDDQIPCSCLFCSEQVE